MMCISIMSGISAFLRDYRQKTFFIFHQICIILSVKRITAGFGFRNLTNIFFYSEFFLKNDLKISTHGKSIFGRQICCL